MRHFVMFIVFHTFFFLIRSFCCIQLVLHLFKTQATYVYRRTNRNFTKPTRCNNLTIFVKLLLHEVALFWRVRIFSTELFISKPSIQNISFETYWKLSWKQAKMKFIKIVSSIFSLHLFWLRFQQRTADFIVRTSYFGWMILIAHVFINWIHWA